MIETLLNEEWCKKLLTFERLWLGLSGGLDSCVLLHNLATIPQLKSKLTAIHVNHGLSAYAQDWQKLVEKICHELHIPLIAEKVDFNRQSNIEAGARKARYALFHTFVEAHDALLLAHHQNDQAETLLLHLCRGTGIDGLSAMVPRQPSGKGILLRPLLHHTREQLEEYAHRHQLLWVNDESNEDTRFNRNFLRQQVIPLLQQKWPALINHLAHTANHCAEAQCNLTELAWIDCAALKTPSKVLFLPVIANLSDSRLINVLRVFLKNNGLRLPSRAIVSQIIFELIKAKKEANPSIQWGQHCIRRFGDNLYLLAVQSEDKAQEMQWTNFPKPLHLGLGKGVLQAYKNNLGMIIPENSLIEVRYRQGGETIVLKGQTKSVKKLMQEWQIPPWLRASMPFIYINNQLAAIVNYAISDEFYSSTQENVYHIRRDC